MKRQIQKGVTNQTLIVFIQDSSSSTGAGLAGLVYNSAGLVCYYARPGVTAAQLTLATQTVTGAHSDGGFVEIDATNLPGFYRLDTSDAMVATGVDSVAVMLKGATNMAPLPLELELVAYNPQDSVRLGITALPNANAQAVGGLFTRGTGAGQINQDADGRIDTNVVNLVTAAILSIWNQVTSALVTVGRIGTLLVDNINATISSRSSHDAEDVRVEMDNNSVDLDLIIAYVDELETRLTVARTDNLDEITAVRLATLTDWINGGRLDTILDTINAAVAGLSGDAMRGTDGANTVTPDAAGVAASLIGALNDVSTVEVLAQIEAALDDTIPELGVAIPTATPNLRTGLMLLYMALRNKLDVSAADGKEIHDNAGGVIARKDLSDNGTIYSETEMTAGP